MVDFHGVKAKEKPAWQRAFWTILDVLKKVNGGAKGIRTPDLLNAIQALSQLSYSPTQNREIICKMQKSVKEIFVTQIRRKGIRRANKTVQQGRISKNWPCWPSSAVKKGTFSSSCNNPDYGDRKSVV